MKLKIFLFLIFSVAFSAIAQNINQTIELADNAKSAENYQAAVEYYERVLFFDSNQEHYPSVSNNIAECYFSLHDYPNAIKYYSLAFNLSQDDSLRNFYSLRKIESLILNHNFSYAYIELLENEEANKGKKEWTLYAAVSCFGMEQYDDSKKYFLHLIPSNNSKDSILVEKSFLKLSKYQKTLKPNRAKWMSFIIPGLGQFYSGNIKNGLNSLILNGLIIYLTIELSITYTVMDALLATGPWIQRYYLGGTNNAKHSCEMQLAKRKNQVYQNLLEIVK
jgi:tetratricopeptide (TPR) repeat protein